MQLTITPVPDLCPGNCRLEGGFATILSFPLSSFLGQSSDDNIDYVPFITAFTTPLIVEYANGSIATTFTVQTRPVPDSLSDFLTGDEAITTQRIWTQFGTQL